MVQPPFEIFLVPTWLRVLTWSGTKTYDFEPQRPKRHVKREKKLVRPQNLSPGKNDSQDQTDWSTDYAVLHDMHCATVRPVYYVLY